MLDIMLYLKEQSNLAYLSHYVVGGKIYSTKIYVPFCITPTVKLKW